MLNLMLISNHCMKRSLRLPLSIQPDTLRDKLATQANKKQAKHREQERNLKPLYLWDSSDK